MSGLKVKGLDELSIDPGAVMLDRVAACGTVFGDTIGGSIQPRRVCDGCSEEFTQLGKPEFAGADLCVDCLCLGRVLQAAFLEERQRAEVLLESPRAAEVRRKVRGLHLMAHDEMEPEDVCGVELHVPTAVTSFLSRERWWLMALGFAVVFVAVVWL